MAAISVLTTATMFPTAPPSTPFIPGLLALFLLGVLTFQFRAGLVGVVEYGLALVVVSVTSFATVGRAPSLAALAAVAVISIDPAQRSTVLTFFARISYSLYLLHWPVGHYALSVIGMKYVRAESDAARIFVLVVSLAICIASAYVLSVVVERPAQRWARRFRYGTAAAPDGAAWQAAG